MKIVVTQAEGRVPVTVFQVKGEIAASTYEQFEQQAREAYEAGMRYLLLDMSDVTFLSSAGIRAIHSVYTMLHADAPGQSDEEVREGIRAGTYKSSHLKLLQPRRQVLDTMQMTGLDMYLEIHTDRQKAIDSF